MRTATLRRIEKYSDSTLGLFIPDEGPEFWTLEPPWRDNQTDVSCIPTGSYLCEYVPSEKFGNVYRLKDVPNRTAIEIHPGNFPTDTHGCILVGCGITGTKNNQTILIQSRDAFYALSELMDWDSFTLEVVEAFQESP